MEDGGIVVANPLRLNRPPIKTPWAPATCRHTPVEYRATLCNSYWNGKPIHVGGLLMIWARADIGASRRLCCGATKTERALVNINESTSARWNAGAAAGGGFDRNLLLSLTKTSRRKLVQRNMGRPVARNNKPEQAAASEGRSLRVRRVPAAAARYFPVNSDAGTCGTGDGAASEPAPGPDGLYFPVNSNAEAPPGAARPARAIRS